MIFYIFILILIIFFVFFIMYNLQTRKIEIEIHKLSKEIDSIYEQYNLISETDQNLPNNPYLIGFLGNIIFLNLYYLGIKPKAIDGLNLVEKCFNLTNINFNRQIGQPEISLSKGDWFVMARNRLVQENDQVFLKGVSDSANVIGLKRGILRQEILNESEIQKAYEETKSSNLVLSPEVVSQYLIKIYFQRFLNL